jgi:hypothetical protein
MIALLVVILLILKRKDDLKPEPGDVEIDPEASEGESVHDYSDLYSDLSMVEENREQ